MITKEILTKKTNTSGKHVCKSEMYPFLTITTFLPLPAKVLWPNSTKAHQASISFQFIQNLIYKHITNLNSSQQSQDSLDQMNKIWKINRITYHKLNQLNDLVFYFSKREDEVTWILTHKIYWLTTHPHPFTRALHSYETLN